MKRLLIVGLVALLVAPWILAEESEKTEWTIMFNGKDLKGWKVSEDNPDTFRVADGAIVTHGPRAHLFYEGDPKDPDDHVFKNFELKAEVMTFPKANSGIYFHTEYQKEGWPNKGFEAQVNNTSGDPRKTGSLYAVKDHKTASAKDNEWFTYHIRVMGNKVVLRSNEETITEWEQTEGEPPNKKMPGRVLDKGTIALQGHDPGSKVLYRNIQIRRLPD